MPRVIRNKGFFEKFRVNITNFKLFFVLGILTIGTGVSYYLVTQQQDIRQQASVTTNIEFGFNTHVSAANNNLDINAFKSNIDRLAQGGQKWIRFDIIAKEIASETPNSIPTGTPTPTPTPGPGLIRVTTDPAAEVTISVKDNNDQIVQQKAWSIDWASLPAGTYTLSFTYPYTTINNQPPKIPPPTQAIIYPNKTTTVVVDIVNGTAIIQSVQGVSTNAITWNESNLTIYDQAIDYARQKGLKIFLVSATPGFAKGYSMDDYNTVTAQFYDFLSKRFGAKISIWQIFNEADTHFYRDYSIMSDLTSSYLTELNSVIAVAKAAIKSNVPQAFITANASGYPMNDTTVNKWYQFFDVLSSNLDALSVSMYPAPNTTEIAKMGNRVDTLKQKYAKDVIVSETGVCTMTGGFSETDQSNFLVQSINSLKFSSVNVVLLYEIMDEATNSGLCEGTFGIVKTDGSKKISYDPVIAAMQFEPTLTPSPTPTTAPLPTSTPTPSPTIVPTSAPPTATPTITATNKGFINVITSPPTNSTIKIINALNGQLILTGTGSISTRSIDAGSYYVSFSFTKTSGYNTPRATLFKIYTDKTTEITGDFKTGKTFVVYK